jgi:hypothetical protein
MVEKNCLEGFAPRRACEEGTEPDKAVRGEGPSTGQRRSGRG